jgi:transglutaminase-like putative cysteine protease
VKFVAFYRISLYIMLTLAALILNIDAAQSNQLAMLFPFAVAGACAVAFFTVDRKPNGGLTRDLANWLAFCSLGLSILEWSIDPSQLVIALGHWLIYLSLIQIFLPSKSARDDWYLFALALVQVLIGGYLSQSDHVGLLLGAWALSTLWTLGLSHLNRESLRGKEMAVLSGAPDDKTVRSGDPYPGLFDPPFYFSAFRVAAATLALGGLIFLVMPRWHSSVAFGGTGQAVKHMTGFTEEVQLGQIGEILEDDSVVMHVELRDDDGIIARPFDDTLWRGVVMQTYEDGNWYRQPPIEPERPDYLDRAPARGQLVHWKFQINANDTDALFAVRPVLKATSTTDSVIEMSRTDGTLHRKDPRNEFLSEVPTPGQNFEYNLISLSGGTEAQTRERFPSLKRIHSKLLRVPDAIAPRLEAFARPIVNALPPADREDRVRVAKALENHFTSSGQFHYSLKMTRVDDATDPIIDFLENRKEGHCAYYASALTLLLRSQGIPARLVNGFKGGDWNDFMQKVVVRQKHAHSWVEALVSENPSEDPLWMSLDPTPGTERQASVARVGGRASRFRNLGDFLRFAWTFYIVGFNSDRQQRLIYEPARQLIAYAADGFRFMGRNLRALVAWLLHFRNVQEFFSLRGFLVSITIMLAMVLVVRLATRLFSRWRKRRAGADRDRSALGTGVAIYNRLARLLRTIGLERAHAETPREFARRAALLLAAKDAASAPISDVPPLIVDAFYRIRFGNEDLGARALEELDHRLDALEACFSPDGRTPAPIGS